MTKAKETTVDTSVAPEETTWVWDEQQYTSTGVTEEEAKEKETSVVEEEAKSVDKTKAKPAKEVTFICTHFPDLIICCATKTVQFTGGELVTSDEEVIKNVKGSQPYEMGRITIKK